uniref:hypothetical protein n=2 Tax=uncultured Cetobacterium sp. TaxID=527638 RepID=UPI00260F7B9A
MANIMIYDSEIDLDLDYFCKFKNLKIVDFKSFVKNIKEFWNEAELVIDGTSKGQLFNKACAEKESFVFYKDSKYTFYKNKKIISIPDLRVVEFNKNKDNFSQENINKFSKEVNLINSILEMTCSSYIDFLEKEI